ncbi:CHASE2 domain-containing protein [bacterium]|nr:CHASE2 domain-containing protein [bacterium]
MKFLKIKYTLNFLTSYRIVGISLGCLVSIILIFITSNIYLFEDFELKTLDLRFRLRGSALPNPDKNAVFEDIIIVDINDYSLEKLGRFQQWPRSYHAKIIDYLKKGNPKVIGFDIFFIEEDQDLKEDLRISKATLKAGNVVHSMILSKKEEKLKGTTEEIYKEDHKEELIKKHNCNNTLKNYQNNHLIKLIESNASSLPIPTLLKNSAGIGYVSITPDSDGIIRNLPLIMKYKSNIYPSFALEIARIFLKAKKEEIRLIPEEKCLKIKDIKIPISDEGKMLINYIGPPYSYRYIPYEVILREDIPVEFFRDKIILVGASAPGLYDLSSTPFSPVYPGIEVHANIIYNILNKKPLVPLSQKATLGIVIFLGALTGFFSSYLRLVNSIFMVLIIVLSYLITSIYFFEVKNVWLATIQPIMNILFCYLVVWIYRYSSVEEQIFSDQLTKVYNRRYLDIKLEKEINSANWLHLPLSLLIIDADHFKRINDIYGHLTGDKVLEEIASILKLNIRSKDTVARYGGEEFVIIFPKCNTDQAYVIAERIRKSIAERQFYDISENQIKVTISGGIATYPINALNKKSLVSEADQALYQAKDSGRNMIMIAGRLW